MNALSCCFVRRLVVVTLMVSGGASLRLAMAQEDVLPGTQKLELTEPLDVVMVRGISEFAEQEISLSRDRREAHWHRDYSSPEAYEKSIAPNRERLRTYIGAVDERVKDAPVLYDPIRHRHNSVLAGNQLRVDVFENVSVEIVTAGRSNSPSRVILISDPESDPEEYLGCLPGLPAHHQLAKRIVDEGINVFMPVVLNRSDEFSGNTNVRFTNQPHREFIYRGAFEMGRHIVGYEVQKILATVDLQVATNSLWKKEGTPIVVWGHGEGGLLALHAAAIDTRIDLCVVSGYFQERESVWREPIYRNVWRQLSEFGDADIASLIAPRQLIIEACTAPEVDGPPDPRPGRSGGAAPGAIRTPVIDSVEREFARAKAHFDKLGAGDNIRLIKSGDGTGPAGASKTVALIQKAFNAEGVRHPLIEEPEDESHRQHIIARQKRQFEELRRHTQRLMHLSDKVRDKYWAGADRSSLAKWEETQEAYRTKVYDELIGRIPYDLLPPNARTRKIIDEPTHTGYEVVLDVWEKGSGQPSAISSQPEGSDAQPTTLNPQRLPSVIAGGILLLPKDLKPGEKRPVVVCQHGLEGVPMDTIIEDPKSPAFAPYKGFSSALVKRGFIVYAPQNPYRGHDDFRVIQRKSNPLGRSLFSYIIPQHQQTLNWLASLPFVDADRIAFYGLSYGGKTAVRVPPMLPAKESPEVALLMKEKGWSRLECSWYGLGRRPDNTPIDTFSRYSDQNGKADVYLTWGYANGGGVILSGIDRQVIKPDELTAYVSSLPSHDFACINEAKNAPFVKDPEAVGGTKWFEKQLFAAGCKRVLQSNGLASGAIVSADTFAGDLPSPGYCLSICSADFNEWVMKNASYEDRYSYIFTGEYEIFEWNMGHVANYAELSNLMTPRPFMVERGHDDGVAPDEWVAWEYAKVKRHYDKLGIGDRTELEVFNGPHTINGVGTYKFLHKHLDWPEPK